MGISLSAFLAATGVTRWVFGGARTIQAGSKYKPHQGKKESARRVNQLKRGNVNVK